MNTLLALGLLLTTGYVEVGTTASGAMSGPGVAACPPRFALGSRLLVDGVGEVTCLDRYAPWLSERVDVWTETIPEAYAITGQRQVWLITTNTN